MPIGVALAEIAEIAEIAGDLCPALRRTINPMPIGVALAEIAETAETPGDQVTRKRIISLWFRAIRRPIAVGKILPRA
jgi:hypothetical protein